MAKSAVNLRSLMKMMILSHTSVHARFQDGHWVRQKLVRTCFRPSISNCFNEVDYFDDDKCKLSTSTYKSWWDNAKRAISACGCQKTSADYDLVRTAPVTMQCKRETYVHITTVTYSSGYCYEDSSCSQIACEYKGDKCCPSTKSVSHLNSIKNGNLHQYAIWSLQNKCTRSGSCNVRLPEQPADKDYIPDFVDVLYSCHTEVVPYYSKTENSDCNERKDDPFKPWDVVSCIRWCERTEVCVGSVMNKNGCFRKTMCDDIGIHNGYTMYIAPRRELPVKINKKIVFEAENAKLPTSSPDVINGETTLPGRELPVKINKKNVFEAENAELSTSSPDAINTTLPGKKQKQQSVIIICSVVGIIALFLTMVMVIYKWLHRKPNTNENDETVIPNIRKEESVQLEEECVNKVNNAVSEDNEDYAEIFYNDHSFIEASYINIQDSPVAE